LHNKSPVADTPYSARRRYLKPAATIRTPMTAQPMVLTSDVTEVRLAVAAVASAKAWPVAATETAPTAPSLRPYLARVLRYFIALPLLQDFTENEEAKHSGKQNQRCAQQRINFLRFKRRTWRYFLCRDGRYKSGTGRDITFLNLNQNKITIT